MNPYSNRLARALREPERLAALSLEEWDHLIPMARRAGLLPRLALAVERQAGFEALPERVRPHLWSAKVLAEKHRRDAVYEIDRLARLLHPITGRVVLLKGAAYLTAGLAPAPGRMFNDIDILVPRNLLAGVESVLGLAGWHGGDIDPYDDQYYRRWMHQLPPLSNGSSTIDVHHTLVPDTARIELDADDVLKRVTVLPERPELAVLAPPDMVLHSAVHLFNDGEYDRGLRDLDDLNLLLRQFGVTASFWETLLERAAALHLTRPLFYALRYAVELLGTPVPPDVMRASAAFGPGPIHRLLMDGLFLRALRSPHPEGSDRLTAPALQALYVRAHYLRMPLRLLVPHLTRKALRRRPREAEPGAV